MPRPISPQHPEIWLASGSPRRRELLFRLGLHPIVHAVDVEEVPDSTETPQSYTRRLAATKGRTCRDRLTEAPDWVVGADTVVTIDGAILEKPLDDAHAMELLQRLVGRTHHVVTAFWIGDRVGDVEYVETTTTAVRFHPHDEAALERYIATKEGRDKAGSYGIQGVGAFLVERIEGCYSNVVGLPQFAVVRALTELGALEGFPWRSS